MKKEEETSMYCGVLMSRYALESGIYFYKPLYLIEGTIDNRKDGTYFIDESGNMYLTTNDSSSLSIDDELSVAYCISLEDLYTQYPNLSKAEAKSEYFESICMVSHFGFYLLESDSIVLVSCPLLDMASQLNTFDLQPGIGDDAIAFSDLIESSTDCQSKQMLSDMLEKYNGDDLIVISADYFEEIMKTENLEEMRDKLTSIYKASKEMNSYFEDDLQNTAQSQIFQNDSISVNSATIVTLFEESYTALLQITNLEEIYIIISKLIDFYTECSVRLDEKEKTDAVLACQDFLYRLIDEWESVNSCKTLSSIKTEFTKIMEKEKVNIIRLSEIYGSAKDVIQKEEQMKKEKEFNEVFTLNQDNSTIINVREIKKFFDDKIIGQEEAKRDVIQALIRNKLLDDVKNRNSCLLVGPTGSGKTLIAQTVSECFDMPMEIIDTTQITVPGYIGANIEDFLARLLAKTKGDLKRAESGIVVFDEIDKKGSDGNGDISGKGVLNTLLPFIDGTTYNVKYNNKTVPFNTSKLTIFATGAFTDVARDKKETSYQGGNMGFQIDVTNMDKQDIVYDELNIEDMAKYGHMPIELLGRFSTITQLSGHTKESLKRILVESNISSLLSEKKIFSKLGIDLRWTEGYLDAVANCAFELKTGARSLKSTVEKSIKEARWEILENLDTYCSIILTEKTVLDNRDCELIDQNGLSHNLKDILASKNIETIETQKVKRLFQK